MKRLTREEVEAAVFLIPTFNLDVLDGEAVLPEEDSLIGDFIPDEERDEYRQEIEGSCQLELPSQLFDRFKTFGDVIDDIAKLLKSQGRLSE